MPPARRAFLSGLIDYAGLFPPAALDLEPALDTYRSALGGPDAWMLERFILPAARLDELAARVGASAPSDPLRLSVLGVPPRDGESWADAAARTVAIARAFDAEHDGRVVSDRFEIRLPTDAAALPDADTLADLDGELQGASPTARVALEAPFRTHPDTVEPAVEAIAEANGRAGRPAFALKLRCGGVTADLVPTVDELATALSAAIRAGVPFKATAGLHHPVRMYREEVEAEMHGFVNVFGGATLARLHGLGADALAEILADTDPASFRLADELGWNRLSATAAEVADARSQLALSFGSCSFDEPREDLRALGWL